MRKVFTASVFALFGLMVVPANAMPFPSLIDEASGVTPVAFGCGVGRTRGPYGGCHPIGGYGVVRRVCMGLTAIIPTRTHMAITHTPTDTAITHTRTDTAIITTIADIEPKSRIVKAA